MYVRQLMLLNEGPVTMTTIKLNVQFDAVLNALAGARMRRPTISAGCTTLPVSLELTATRGRPERQTYIEPCHAKPSDGEERIEHEQQDRRGHLRPRGVHAPENSEKDHRDRLADGAEQHEGPTADAINEEDGDERREEVLCPIAGSDDARFDVVDAQPLEQQCLWMYA